MISMKVYRALNKAIDEAHKDGTRITVDEPRILKDIKRRKTKRIVMAVFVCVGVVALAVAMVLASQGIIPSNGMSPYVTALGGWYVAMAWALCWVGFPVGWNMESDTLAQAKGQQFITYTIDEHGYVDKKVDKVSAPIGAFLWSVLMGCICMAFSFIIAVIQIFTTKGDIEYIQTCVLNKADK